jgi:hypothetical protein
VDIFGIADWGLDEHFTNEEADGNPYHCVAGGTLFSFWVICMLDTHPYSPYPAQIMTHHLLGNTE